LLNLKHFTIVFTTSQHLKDNHLLNSNKARKVRKEKEFLFLFFVFRLKMKWRIQKKKRKEKDYFKDQFCFF